MSHLIREIEEKDVKQALKLIKDLAEYGNIGELVVITAEVMIRDLFGPKKDWYGFVASDQNNIIDGVCFYAFSNTSRVYNSSPLLQIDGLYIKEEKRGLGLGKILIKKVAEEAMKQGIKRLELWCFKDNQLALDFYDKLGAYVIDSIHVCRLYPEKILAIEENDKLAV